MKIDQNWNKKGLVTMLGISVICIILVGVKAAYSEDNSPINSVIAEGLTECSQLQSESCFGVMHTLNNICQVEFFPACFDQEWNLFMNHLKKIYKHQNMDDFVTINNEHFGNSDMLK